LSNAISKSPPPNTLKTSFFTTGFQWFFHSTPQKFKKEKTLRGVCWLIIIWCGAAGAAVAAAVAAASADKVGKIIYG
jgi:hypothetical protein